MTDNQDNNIELLKLNRANNFFWLGFVIYSLSYSISTSGSVNYIICQLIQILGLFLIISASMKILEWKFDTNYIRTIFTIYIFWLFTVICRGFLFDYQFMKFILFDATFGIFIYFAPLILLLPRNLLYYKKVFNVVLILGIAYLLYDMLFIKDLLYPGTNLRSQTIVEYFSLSLSLSCGFLIMTYMYHTRKKWLIALFVILFTFFLAVIRARRGLMFMSINILISSFFIYYYANKVKLLIFIFSFIVILSIYFLGAKIYNENQNGLFGYVTTRLYEKTRTGVEQYFYRDMNTVDWIIGKGIMGKYYCPGIDQGNGTFTTYRGVIETGYLQMILKGGIISLLLYLLIIIPAIIKGLFYSKNVLSKAAGTWIFLSLINLYPATVMAFSMQFLLVWISVGICYSSEIRNMSENTVAEILDG